jgi:hypothetical protein
MAYYLVLNNTSGKQQAPKFWVNYFDSVTSYARLDILLSKDNIKWLVMRHGKIVDNNNRDRDENTFSMLEFGTEEDAIQFKLRWS